MIANLPDRPVMPDNLNYQVTRREWEILNLHSFTCSCCDFTSRSTAAVPSGYMEVHIKDNEPFLLCVLCSSARRLGRTVNGTKNHGLILHAPNLNQGHVTNVARILSTAIIEELPFQHEASAIQAKFQQMQASIENYPFMVDEGSITLAVNALSSVRRAFEGDVNMIFEHLRYFPSRATYRHVFQYWYSVNPEYFQQP